MEPVLRDPSEGAEKRRGRKREREREMGGDVIEGKGQAPFPRAEG